MHFFIVSSNGQDSFDSYTTEIDNYINVFQIYILMQILQ